jgi:hypothetical protein
MALILAVAGCGGGFLSYTVEVVSLTLTKANGAVVETLPVSTRAWARSSWAAARPSRSLLADKSTRAAAG